MILASYVRPFDGKQVIYVLDEMTRDTVDQTIVSLEKYSDAVMELLDTYNVNVFELHGPISFCKHLRKQISEKEFFKYSKNRLNIILSD